MSGQDRKKWLAMLPSGTRQAGVVFTGDVFSKFLTFALTIALLKLLTPEHYRLYVGFITVLALVNALTDIGLHHSFIRFYSLYRNSEPRRATAHFRLALRVKLLLTAGFSTALYLCAGVVADLFLGAPELAPALRLLAAGVLGSSLVEFVLAVMQARQKFASYAGIRLAEGASKTVVVFAFVLAGSFSLDLVFDVYVYTSLLLALLSIWLLRGEVRAPAMRSSTVRSELLNFGKWMTLLSLSTLVLVRIDVFMVSSLLRDTPIEAGLYMAATRLCVPILVMGASVATVLYPKAMALRSVTDLRTYLRNTVRIVSVVLLLGIAYLIVVHVATPLYFPRYAPFLPVFTVLWVGMTWNIVGSPFTLLILSLNRSRFAALLGIGQLVFTSAALYLLIRSHGSIGAAWAVTAGMYLFGGVALVYVFRNRKHIGMPNAQDPEHSAEHERVE